jgi:hypothetical protein
MNGGLNMGLYVLGLITSIVMAALFTFLMVKPKHFDKVVEA